MNLNLTKKLTHSAWMIEEAHRYSQASELLFETRNLGNVAQINAALSIEIALKSFFVSVTEYEGKVYARYKFEKEKAKNIKTGADSHNLHLLATSLPDEIKAYLLSPFELSTLETFKDTFVVDRYKYEINSIRGHSKALIDLSRNLVNKIITLYKVTGCNDPWILNYPEI
jgi:hypothetical protein